MWKYFSVFCVFISLAQGAQVVVNSTLGIRHAIQVANDGDTVILPIGGYTGVNNIDFFLYGRTLTFQSQTNNPLDVSIDCEGDGSFCAIVANASIPSNLTTSIAVSGISFLNCGGFVRDELTGGGSFYIDTQNLTEGVSFTINNCRFVNNQVNEGGVLYAIANSSISLSISTSAFLSNSADEGAVLYLAGNVSASITNSSFVGGAIVAFETAAVYLTSCNFSNNAAQDDAGAIYVNYAQVTLTNCLLTNSFAYNYGGAILASDSSVWVTSSQFTSNTAYNGGALFLEDGWANISSSFFGSNYAGQGGGAIAVVEYGDAFIYDSIFTNNQAIYGGAIAIANSSGVWLSNGSVSLNTAAEGAGIYTEFSSTLSLLNCNLSSNYANSSGDSLYCEGSNVTLTDTNVVPQQIRATEEFGVYCDSSSPDLICSFNTTQSGNWTAVCNDKTLPGSGGGLAGWKIAIIVVFVVGGVLAIGAVLFFFVFRRKSSVEFAPM